MKYALHALALAALASTGAQAQTASADQAKTQRVEVTGSLIKRADKETPSVVRVYGREEMRTSGYGTVAEMLRADSAVDTGSISDGAASGFVGGISTVSLRGLGSQSTLVLINGRRIAPVAAVDINFGRGNLVSINNIPAGMLERVDVLKDGASAMYGSDAIAGVINYITRKDLKGVEANASYGSRFDGAGKSGSVSISAGFGDYESQRFNISAGVELTKRNQVMQRELKDNGDLGLYNQFLNTSGSLSRFTADSSASLYSNYYRVPASLTGSTTIGGISVANNNLQGANYLGTLPGCPDDRTVGKGVPNRPDGFAATTATLRDGYCRYNLDNAAEAISAQEGLNAMLRGAFKISDTLSGWADLMYARTETSQQRTPTTLTTALVTSANRTATTWPKLDGSFLRQNAIILPANHPDNPTRGTASAQEIQLIHRFEDLPLLDVNTVTGTRATVGIEGTLFGWDFDSVLMYSRQDLDRVQQGRLRSSLLNASIASGTYRFGQWNTPAAQASVASDARNEGKSEITSLDIRGSRELFKMAGGMAAIAAGVEARNERLEAVPDDVYKTGDYIGLVANGASGKRNSFALYGELGLPATKNLELQVAGRAENYSDFGTATTGKVGFKFAAVPSQLVFRGTAATGYRAPSISQISNSFVLSFHSFGERRVIDSLRCNGAPGFTSKASPSVARDCNVLGYTVGVASADLSGSIPSVVAANPNLKAETSNSATLGLIIQPTKDLDMAIDGWYFHRKDEIRVQRGVDIMDAYNADPTGAASAQVIRDPNPATWLPGVPNSGPIILLTRGYGNYKWTKTSGVDYDINWRFPTEQYGQFSLKLAGTWTNRYDRQVLAGAPTEYLVGTSTIDIPSTRASLTARWRVNGFNVWVRRNHADKITTTSTLTCQTSTTAANALLRAYDRCQVGADRTVDLGVSYSGFKGMNLSASVLNISNSFNRSNGIPSTFTYWDPSLSGQLGRRFSLNVSYKY